MTSASPDRPAAGWSLALAATLVMMLAIQSVSVDVVFPGIPAIRHAFAVSPGEVQLSVSIYIFTFAVTQLAYGPLSDRFGRRPVVLASVVVYTAASVLAALADSFAMLLVARFLQGVGAASAPSIARAVVRDLYGPERSGAVLSYLMAAFGIVAVASPVIGGALTDAFGWRAVFVFCAVYGCLIVGLAWAWLGETLAVRNVSPLDPRGMARNFATIARDRRFAVLTACNCCFYGGMFAWLAGGVYVLIEVLGVSAGAAGAYIGLSTGGFIVGSALAGRAMRRHATLRIVAAGALICLASSVALAAFGLVGAVSVATLVIPAFVFMLGLGGVLPPSMAAGIAPFPRMAGAASALIGFLQMTVGAAMVAATGYLFDGTALPMALLMTVTGVAGLAVLGLYPAGRATAG